MRSIWPAKDPAEALVADFSFANEIAVGETIASAQISCSVLSGKDATPSAVLSGAPNISGSSVLQRFHGGVAGATYLMRCVATLSSGRVLALAAILPVRTA